MVQYFYFLKHAVVNSVGFGIGQVGPFDADFDPAQIIANGIAREATEEEVQAFLDDQAQLALPHGRVGSLPPGGDNGKILAKRSNNNFDAEWVDNEGGQSRQTTKFDFSIATKQPLLPTVPAGKDLIILGVVYSNAQTDMSAFSDSGTGFQSGFNSAADNLDLPGKNDISILTERKKTRYETFHDGGEYNAGVEGETFGGLFGGTLLPKNFTISGDLKQKTINAFEIEFSKMVVSGVVDGNDLSGDAVQGDSLNGKRAYNNPGVVSIFWHVSNEWRIFDQIANAVVFTSADDTDYPSQAVFIAEPGITDDPPTLSLDYDAIEYGPFYHLGIVNGRPTYEDFGTDAYFQFDGTNWNFYISILPGDTIALVGTAAVEPWLSEFQTTLLIDGQVPTMTPGPTTSPLLGEWICSTLDEGEGKPVFFNAEGCKAYWIQGDGKWYLQGVAGGGQTAFESTDDTPTPVGAVFTDIIETEGDAPVPVESETGPTIDITVFYFIKSV